MLLWATTQRHRCNSYSWTKSSSQELKEARWEITVPGLRAIIRKHTSKKAGRKSSQVSSPALGRQSGEIHSTGGGGKSIDQTGMQTCYSETLNCTVPHGSCPQASTCRLRLWILPGHEPKGPLSFPKGTTVLPPTSTRHKSQTNGWGVGQENELKTLPRSSAGAP